MKFPTTPSAWGPVLLTDYPSIEKLTRLRPLLEQQSVQLENRSVRGKASFFADSTLFDVFTLPLARGTPATALTRPHMVVISESIANTCFGETDPVGFSDHPGPGERKHVAADGIRPSRVTSRRILMCTSIS